MSVNAAKARREDKNKNYAQVMQEFANDSVVFFNKCAKPDKNGKLRSHKYGCYKPHSPRSL